MDMNKVLENINDCIRMSYDSSDPIEILKSLVSFLHSNLGYWGEPKASTPSDGADETKISGAFMVTPDMNYHMLVANIGFPDEQNHLLIPIDGGHPGHVWRTKAPLLLTSTVTNTDFKQYLKTARMGSVVFTPIMKGDVFLGQFITATKEPDQMTVRDLNLSGIMSTIAFEAWSRNGGQEIMNTIYPPADGYYVPKEGL